MTWLKKAIYLTVYKALKNAWQDPELKGDRRGQPDTMALFQSPDFPWVFLGSDDPDDLLSVAAKTGVSPEEILRIDVSDLPAKGLPPSVLKVPLPDETNPNEPMWKSPEEQSMWKSVFWNLADDVADTIRQAGISGKPVYVHCKLGKNRSVATLAAALSQLYAEDMNMPKSPDRIISEISQQRFLADPQPEYREFAAEYGQQQMSDIPQRFLHRPMPSMEY